MIMMLLIGGLSCMNQKKDEGDKDASSEDSNLKRIVSDSTNKKRDTKNSSEEKGIGEKRPGSTADNADNKKESSQNDYPVRKNINSKILKVKPVIYSTRSSTILYDNYLVQIETWSDTLFQVFKLPDCKYIGGFGKKGRGPKELPFHDAYGAACYENGVIVYDVYKGFVFIDLTNFESDKNITIQKKIKLPEELMLLNSIFLLNDSIIIGSNNTQDKMRFKYKYTRYNIHSDKIDYFGQYPDHYPESRKKLYPFIYGTKTVVKPDETKFASFCWQVKMFRIYSSDGTIEKEVFLKKQKDFFDGQWIRKNAVKYYTCVRATNEYLYALCQDEHSHDLSGSNPTLEIWDWKGNPIAFLKMDQSICSFDVTDDNSKVYASSFNDMDKIFVYETDRIMP